MRRTFQSTVVVWRTRLEDPFRQFKVSLESSVIVSLHSLLGPYNCIWIIKRSQTRNLTGEANVLKLGLLCCPMDHKALTSHSLSEYKLNYGIIWNINPNGRLDEQNLMPGSIEDTSLLFSLKQCHQIDTDRVYYHRLNAKVLIIIE